ncbi:MULTISPECIES: stage V sporulation protein AD [Fictibacillus]|uniref:Stage V sporulation protein AD n=1 Tax=Fictibacillus enclensis TaxID=1017270 RepID=A0A0V8JEV5_9BACL|nr:MULTISPECIES: stage V sporulation protein AD [Fictibacillus]KSU85638.1 stage V sporulation protein AD [Fictibacillus enclensis]RXY98668.1 stage V sporulation protein AD [Fictibacillus sp. S7]SCC00128.1 stage V sporulation protein AD [Fictibacillus enclensis]
MKLQGRQTWKFGDKVFLNSTGTAVGPMESEGPLGSLFDVRYNDLHCNEKNWELAERRLMEDSIASCLNKAKLTNDDINFFLAGDLLNQVVTANYVARGNEIPFLGVFGACSTSMESLAVGAALVDGGFAQRVVAAVSSHNATAERQFRYPTEYGGQKPDTATFTVTGAGAALISSEPSSVRITSATIGKVHDLGIKDPFDMGSAMAPAAADTIMAHLKETGMAPEEYDLIVTGDLSGVGAPIVKMLLKEKGIDVSGNHRDCGLMVYRPDQEVFAGGSGCGCSAVVTYGHLIKELNSGSLKRILVVATGALLNPTMIQQKESIPTIAHAVALEGTKGGSN